MKFSILKIKQELMQELLSLKICFLKIFMTAKIIFSKPASALLLTGVTTLSIYARIDSLTITQQALLMLLACFILDFITGVYASYIETKAKMKIPKAKRRWNRVLNNLEVFGKTISSEKLRKSVVKAVAYCLFIICAYGIQVLFFVKTFKFTTVSHREFTVTLIVITFCIITELWSVFKENLPRAGYDIGAAIMEVVRGVKKTKKEIEEE